MYEIALQMSERSGRTSAVMRIYQELTKKPTKQELFYL
jgi:hypothetical protein